MASQAQGYEAPQLPVPCLSCPNSSPWPWPFAAITDRQQDDPFSKFMREQENGSSGVSESNGKKEASGREGGGGGPDGKTGTGSAGASSEADSAEEKEMVMRRGCVLYCSHLTTL